MRLSATISGTWGKTEEWIKKMTTSKHKRVLNEVGRLGEESLGSATPVGETGQTASGWRHKVEGTEVSFNNIAHPEESVNIAKIKELGHGTGTGGYVPPRPYMKKAMAPVWKKASDLINEELRK